MRQLLFPFVLLLSLNSSAQRLSVGAAIGPDVWFHHPSSYQANGYNFTLGQAVFVRWDTRERISYEVTIAHNSYNEKWKSYMQGMDAQFNNEIIHRHEKNDAYSLASGVDYRLTKGAKGKLKQYLGLELTPTILYSSGSEEWYDSVSMKLDYAIHSKPSSAFYMWAGVHYSLRYQFSKRLSTMAALTVRVDPEALFSHDTYGSFYNVQHTRASLLFGLSYRLQ